jgi:hypothetical protein
MKEVETQLSRTVKIKENSEIDWHHDIIFHNTPPPGPVLRYEHVGGRLSDLDENASV